MEAKHRNAGGIHIISISGDLDIERAQSFRDNCIKHFADKKVIFNLRQASFVGSTGLQAFLETISGLSQNGALDVGFVEARSEFKRLISNLGESKLHFFENEASAVESFKTGRMPVVVTEAIPEILDGTDASDEM